MNVQPMLLKGLDLNETVITIFTSMIVMALNRKKMIKKLNESKTNKIWRRLAVQC